MTVVLAADLGGTMTKAALVGNDGQMLAQASVPAPAPRPDGRIEPAGWWSGLHACADALHQADRQAFADIAALAITGVTRTPIVVDAAGAPLAAAFTARDARAQEIAQRTAIPPDECAEAAHYDAFHPAARLRWLIEHEPAALPRADAVIDPKDFVAATLTGRIASDSVALARLIAAANSSCGPSLMSRLGLAESLVPNLVAPTSVIAPVRSGLAAPFDALAGKPVIMASHDTWAGVVGLGALKAGRAYNISGTTETFGVLTSQRARAEGLIDIAWGDVFQTGGPGQNGADVLTWLGAVLGAVNADAGVALIERALAQPRSAPLLFLPYLSGERVPFWDADLRAAFVGLSREHGPADLAWAALEGVAFVNAIVLRRAEQAAGITVDEVRLGGGAARIAPWAQIKADILERPVATVATEEPGVLGAAIAAFVGLKTFASLAEAQGTLVQVARRCAPRRQMRDFYRALALLFGKAHDAVQPVSRGLTKLTIPPAIS